MNKKINEMLFNVNNSKLLAGLTMIMLNVGSKYVELGLSRTQEEALKAGLAREMLLFAIFFMATKDIIYSFLLTAAFVIMADYLFNENSKLCIIPNNMKKIAMEIDMNNDNYVSDEEVEHALRVLKQAKQQEKHKQQSEFLSYLQQ